MSAADHGLAVGQLLLSLMPTRVGSVTCRIEGKGRKGRTADRGVQPAADLNKGALVPTGRLLRPEKSAHSADEVADIPLEISEIRSTTGHLENWQ